MKSISDLAAEIKDKMQAPRAQAEPKPARVIIPGKPLYAYSDAEISAFAAACPTCEGLGYVRVGDDLPLDDDNFGRLIPCQACRDWTLEQRRRDDWKRLKPFIDSSDCLKGDLLSYTFDNFQDKTPALKAVKDAVRDWAVRIYKQSDGRRWLYVCGSFGCGKTHLCAAAANGLRAAGVSVLFMTTPVLLGTLKADLDRTEDFIRQLSVVPVLVLDDLGAEPLTEWAASILFRVIDGRYITRRPLLVSSNLPPERLGVERIASRLGTEELSEVVVNPAPDWRKGGK